MASPADILEFFAAMEPLRLGNAPVFKGDADKIFVARIWANILHDVSLEDIQAAQVVYLGSKAGKWWPTPADIRPLCPSVAQAQLAETPRDLWPAVLRACGSATPGADLRRYVDSYAGGISDREWAQVQRALSAAGGVSDIKALTSDFDRSKAGERFKAAVEAQAPADGVIVLDEERRRRLGSRSDMRRIGGRE